MTKAFSHERSKDGKEEWLTPKWITDDLGPFDLDPCSPINRPWDTARSHYNETDDGLSKDWHGKVWLNPPYGNKTNTWMKKLKQHGNGIALIFARTETSTFFDNIWLDADSLFFFKGRISFHHVSGEKSGPAGAPSVLVCYGKQNSINLNRIVSTNEKFKGVFIDLNKSRHA